MGMKKKSEILKELEESVIQGDEEAARKAAAEAIGANLDPVVAIEDGLTKGMSLVGEKFRKYEIFVPHVILSADAMKSALSLLEPRIKGEGKAKITLGKVVIGTVYGDMHDIGKNIVATMLNAARFNVYDVGVEAPARRFIEKAEEIGADIIAVSSLMAVTKPYQRDIIDLLNDMGLRDRYKVIVGGGAVTPEWAEDIGADGYGKDAVEAVRMAKKLVEGKCL